jgi:hypothetical protein
LVAQQSIVVGKVNFLGHILLSCCFFNASLASAGRSFNKIKEMKLQIEV